MKPITMTPETALDRAALIAAQDADAPKLTQRMDAEAMRVLVEHVNALRARVAELEAALADERKLADELAHTGRADWRGLLLRSHRSRHR